MQKDTPATLELRTVVLGQCVWKSFLYPCVAWTRWDHGWESTGQAILFCTWLQSLSLPFTSSDNSLCLPYLCYSLGTCSPFTGRCCHSLKAILFSMSFSSNLTQDGYIRRFRIWNCFDPCWVWSEELFQRTVYSFVVLVERSVWRNS